MIAATALDALILEQTAEAVIYADHKGVIERWNLPLRQCSAIPQPKRSGRT